MAVAGDAPETIGNQVAVGLEQDQDLSRRLGCFKADFGDAGEEKPVEGRPGTTRLAPWRL